jgi:hypothetical protein
MCAGFLFTEHMGVPFIAAFAALSFGFSSWLKNAVRSATIHGIAAFWELGRCKREPP